ncbi:PPE family protein [Mycobacterium xenopi 3993]|nr:PPE family protein [Mycobacterium xenopi 3993]
MVSARWPSYESTRPRWARGSPRRSARPRPHWPPRRDRASPPAGSDPVSVAAANRAAVNSAKLSGHLAGGIKRLADGAQAVTTALNGYVVTDEAGAAEINGGTAGAAAGAAIGAINLPSPPAVDIPNVPVDIPAALASVPADPATVDEALTTGAGAGGLEGHAAAWDGVATQLRTIGAEFRTLGSSLPASWAGLPGRACRSDCWVSAIGCTHRGSGQLARFQCSPIGRVSP